LADRRASEPRRLAGRVSAPALTNAKMGGWRRPCSPDPALEKIEQQANLGASIRCPDGYTSVDEHEDLVRRDELFGKWRSRPPLTREEDVEEVHLFARIACFKVEANKARYRIDVLRKLGDKRSAIEQSELDALEARFRRIPPKKGLIWSVDY
jgi:hypothetical protein